MTVREGIDVLSYVQKSNSGGTLGGLILQGTLAILVIQLGSVPWIYSEFQQVHMLQLSQHLKCRCPRLRAYRGIVLIPAYFAIDSLL